MLSWLINPLRHADSAEVVSLIKRGTLVVLALLWMFAASAAAIAIWLLLSRSIAEVEATALGLEQYARRNIELSDFVAEGLVHYLDHRGGMKGLNKDTRIHLELYQLNKRLPPGSAILLTAPDGRVVAATSKVKRTPVNLSDRPWFRAHVDDGVLNYIGPAIASRVVDGIVYTYSKSYFSPDGGLSGILCAGP